MSAEFTALVAISLGFASVVAQAAGASEEAGASLVAMTLIASALGTALVGWGTKMTQPLTARATFLVAELAAIKAGGLPLLFGMTLFAGAVQLLVSPFLSRLKFIFSAELGFLVISLLGFEMGAVGFTTYLGVGLGLKLAISVASLALIYLLQVLGTALLARMAFLVALALGYLAIWFFGEMDGEALSSIANGAWFGIPQIAPGGWAFSWELVPTFLVPAIVNVIILLGSLAALQEAKAGKSWKGPDMRRIARGNWTMSIGTMFGGLLGGVGIASSSSSTALAISSRTFSQGIAFGVAALTLILASVHKIALIFVYMPRVLIASALIYFGAILVVDSFHFFARYVAKPSDALRMFVPLLVAIGFQAYPSLVSDLETNAHLFTGGRFAYAILLAILLKGLFVLVDNQKRKHKCEQ